MSSSSSFHMHALIAALSRGPLSSLPAPLRLRVRNVPLIRYATSPHLSQGVQLHDSMDGTSFVSAISGDPVGAISDLTFFSILTSAGELVTVAAATAAIRAADVIISYEMPLSANRDLARFALLAGENPLFHLLESNGVVLSSFLGIVPDESLTKRACKILGINWDEFKNTPAIAPV